MHTHTEHRQFTASFNCLPALLRYVDERAAELALASAERLKLRLIAEELFTNTVRHGHRGDSVSPVGLALNREADGVTLRFEDVGPAYNPFEHLDVAAHERPVMDRPVGRLGVVLIDGFAACIRYERAGASNRIRVVLRPETDGPP